NIRAQQGRCAHPPHYRHGYICKIQSFQMVMNGNANRAWRTARQYTSVRKTATVVSYEGSQLIFQFL
ncbi:MAG: hypothetical protein ACKPKO_32410, partial [Candidatus Fonsibacter sp.]